MRATVVNAANVVNAAALAGCLLCAMAGAALPGAVLPGGRANAPAEETAGERTADGALGAPSAATQLVDARGTPVPVRAYQRIVSLNPVADHLLLRLVEPQRLVAVTATTAQDHPESWRLGDRPSIERSDQLERILSLQPDLVIASKFVTAELVTRLQDRGIAVFDLGEMRGVRTTLDNIQTLGALVLQPKRATLLAAQLQRQLTALDHAVPEAQRPPGIYLSIYGDTFFGGTADTSYADLLRYAGVHDLAADHGYRDWPQYSIEQLLELNPALIITQAGMATSICGHDSLATLAACRPPGRVIEVPGQYHSDPGLGLVVAAAQVHDLVHNIPQEEHR